MRSSKALAPRAGVSLASLGTLGVGGASRWFMRAEHADDVAAARTWCEEQNIPWFVLGGGSNVVIADTGFDGLVVQIGMTGTTASRDGDDWLITAGAGESWDGLVALAVDRGLAGVECLSGIPGTVGGTPIQNVGAYGQEVSSTIEHVTVYDCVDHTVRSMRAADCGFSYRMSRFKAADEGRFVVCDVTFRMRPGPPTATYADEAVRRFESHRLLGARRGAEYQAIEGHGRRCPGPGFTQRRVVLHESSRHRSGPRTHGIRRQ